MERQGGSEIGVSLEVNLPAQWFCHLGLDLVSRLGLRGLRLRGGEDRFLGVGSRLGSGSG